MREGRHHDDVHAHNLEAVRAAVIVQGLRSRSAIVAATGLAKSSVSRLVSELVELGVLAERPAPPTGSYGRPRMLVEPAPSALVGLGLEIRADGLAVWLADDAGRVHHRAAAQMPIHVQQPERVLDELTGLAADAIRAAGRGRLTIAGATVAIAPGFTRPQGWVQHEMQERLKRSLTVHSAITLAAIAELADPRGARLDDCFHVTAAAGVSARLIADGRVVRGDGLDGFGHLCVERDGARCWCGRRGCLETYVQRAPVLRAAGLGDASLTDLLEHARSGDPDALAALSRCGRWLGIAVANVVNLLAPPAVVLGGDFAVLAPWIAPALQDELAVRVLGHEPDWPAVIVSRLGSDAAVIGAAAAALEAGPLV